ncbi:MAG: copper chaperone PCu(A)C [Stagnimonas sp.]|nr:copper chaperone PCu(A)C [Stagnimonas sp.]
MRMFRRIFGSLLLLPVLALAAPAAKPSLHIEQAYSYATPAPGITAVGFLTVVNEGAADRLVAVESAAAGRVEIHEMSMDGGMMRMRAVTDGLAVPATGRLALEPGGYHLMLIAPKQALTVGDAVPLTLVFARGGRLETRLQVRSRDAD